MFFCFIFSGTSNKRLAILLDAFKDLSKKDGTCLKLNYMLLCFPTFFFHQPCNLISHALWTDVFDADFTQSLDETSEDAINNFLRAQDEELDGMQQFNKTR